MLTKCELFTFFLLKRYILCYNYLRKEEDVMSKIRLKTKLNNKENITIELDGEDFEVTPSMVDIRISAKEGFDVAYQNNNFVILNTELTEDLVLEGLAREFISKVQNMRKNKDFDIVDRIKVYYLADSDVNNSIVKFGDLIKKEILATDMIEEENLEETIDLNGHEVKIRIEKN